MENSETSKVSKPKQGSIANTLVIAFVVLVIILVGGASSGKVPFEVTVFLMFVIGFVGLLLAFVYIFFSVKNPDYLRK